MPADAGAEVTWQRFGNVLGMLICLGGVAAGIFDMWLFAQLGMDQACWFTAVPTAMCWFSATIWFKDVVK